MTISLLPVRLESEWLLLDASKVKEILGAEPWIRIPHTRAELPGVLAWRGRAIPVLDLGPIFGGNPLGAQQKRARTLIVELERSVVAVPIDAAREVQMISDSALRGAHVKALPFAQKEVELFSTVMPVLDLGAVLSRISEKSEELRGAASA